MFHSEGGGGQKWPPPPFPLPPPWLLTFHSAEEERRGKEETSVQSHLPLVREGKNFPGGKKHFALLKKLGKCSKNSASLSFCILVQNVSEKKTQLTIVLVPLGKLSYEALYSIHSMRPIFEVFFSENKAANCKLFFVRIFFVIFWQSVSLTFSHRTSFR